jgi:transcription elongation GreA/GreB family factor
MQADQLLRLVRKGKLEELETAWMDVVSGKDIPGRSLLPVVQLLSQRGHAAEAESLLWFLIDALRGRGDAERALAAARDCAASMPENAMLRDALTSLYLETQSARDDIEDLISLTVGARDIPLNTAVAGMDNFLAFDTGAYVLDPHSGDVGRVEGFDATRGGMVVAYGDSQKVYGGGLLGRLQSTESDDFRALMAFERERMAALAKDDPIEFVSLALTTLEKRMPLRRLRLYLEPAVGQWSKWWSKARVKLARSATIGMTKGSSPSLFLRTRPLTHGQRMMRRFNAAADPISKLALALDVAQEARRHGHIETDVLQHLVDSSAALSLETIARSAHVSFCAVAVAELIVRRFPEQVKLNTVLPGRVEAIVLADPEGLALAVPDKDVLLCALDAVRHRVQGEWKAYAAALMPVASHTVCVALGRQLKAEDARDVVEDACQRIMARSDRSSGALAWLWRICTSVEPPKSIHSVNVVTALLSTVSALVRTPGLTESKRRDLINEVRNALFVRDGEPLKDALRGAEPTEIARVKVHAEFNPGLTAQRQNQITDMLHAVAPDLFKKSIPLWEQDVIYTTEAGLQARKKELEHLLLERMPEVIKELGEAASFGDLSENAEYKAALDERARLAETGARMQNEISSAHLITHEACDVSWVTIGSKVSLRNLADQKESALTFLGPWDARPDVGILAYNAPLGLAFMGAEEGDEVSFQAGDELRRWVILSIEPVV